MHCNRGLRPIYFLLAEEENALDTSQILAELVRFDTTSSRSNHELIDWTRHYLAALGIACVLVPDETGEKAGLLATIGPDAPGGIVLSGHTDVVPVAGQMWTSEPFCLTARKSRYYGRGTCDMKGFLSVVLATAPAMKAAALVRPIHIALTYDEEIGCLGVRPLIAEMQRRLPPIDAVIVGEPTEMNVVDRHKSAYAELVTFTGVAAHSSKPHLGVSAISYAVRFLAALQALVDTPHGPHNGRRSDGVTLNLARISGGTAHNIISDKCMVEWSLRCDPTARPQTIVRAVHHVIAQLDAAMKAENALCRIAATTALDILPLREEPDSCAVALCLQLTGRNTTLSADYGTEAGLFQSAGHSTVVCGPGSIEQAHAPDEFIEEDQLGQCERFLHRLIETLCH